MKKFLPILLILILILSLAACSKEPAASSESGSSSSGSVSVASSSKPAPKAYTVEEAAKVNASIKPSDVNLIQFDKPKAGSPVATLKTSAGDITIVLYPEQAPKAVENFVKHAKDGYYNGMNFYKVIHDFIIQSGAPADKAPESIFKGEDGKPTTFESEFSLDLWSFRGALAMVNKGALRPDTNTSEFFIVQAQRVSPAVLETMKAAGYPEKVIAKYEEVGGVPGFDWHNTIFGMVTEGMDIVDQIAEAETDATNTPAEPVIITSITIKD